MSSIMETGLSCASRPALDDVAGPTRHSTAARKQAANGGGGSDPSFDLKDLDAALDAVHELRQFVEDEELRTVT